MGTPVEGIDGRKRTAAGARAGTVADGRRRTDTEVKAWNRSAYALRVHQKAQAALQRRDPLPTQLPDEGNIPGPPGPRRDSGLSDEGSIPGRPGPRQDSGSPRSSGDPPSGDPPCGAMEGTIPPAATTRAACGATPVVGPAVAGILSAFQELEKVARDLY